MIKVFIWFAIYICIALPASAQNNFPLMETTVNSSIKDSWENNLNKNVWSHSHAINTVSNKAVIRFEDLDNYKTIGNDEELSISPNAKYIAYAIRSEYKFDSLVIQSTTNSWRRSFIGASPGFFSANSKQYIFLLGETLYLICLGEDKIDSIKEVKSYKPSGNKEWIAIQFSDFGSTVSLRNLQTKVDKEFTSVNNYGFERSEQWFYYETVPHLLESTKELTIYNLNTGYDRIFEFVDSYILDGKAQALVINQHDKFNYRRESTSLLYINLPEGSPDTIWTSTDTTIKINSYNLDKSGKQVVFNLSKNKVNSIWYYRIGMDNAIEKANCQTEGVDPGYSLQGGLFTVDGRYIFFFLQKQPESLPKSYPEDVKMDVWSYKDNVLQSSQVQLLKMPEKKYKAIISVEGVKVIRLEREFETMKCINGDFSIVSKSGKKITNDNEPSYAGDRFWEDAFQLDSTWLVSLSNGSRRLIKTKGGGSNTWPSPGGRYVVYFDSQNGCNYYSIESKTGKITKISTGVAGETLSFKGYYDRFQKTPFVPAGIAGWLSGDSGLLVYDKYDIWKLDLSGRKPAVNITNGYGRKNQIVFSLSANGETAQYEAQLRPLPIFPANSSLLLSAFNRLTKYSGVYQMVLGIPSNPELLFSGPYALEKIPPTMGHFEYAYNQIQGITTTKAKDSSIWVVKRQSTTDAPNYFMTADFKKYRRLTNMQPQKTYNWLTAELHSFKQLDGTISQGILYKPENFDPTKKYPVIIAFYWSFSNHLYTYPPPNLIWAPSAPAWNPAIMVSHGYLVFTPDLYFSKNGSGPDAINSVEGAAKYLTKLHFVNTNQIAVCGHSNSGGMGYYILTHSKNFACISVGGAWTDLIGGALSIDDHGKSLIESTEKGTYGQGLGNLWNNKTKWIDGTTVLQADKVGTPLLLFHNERDGNAVQHAIEMFTALRRLDKKVWWIDYNDAGHTISGNEAKDFSIRYIQFFDHYLKGAPAPKWMTQGIPAAMKGIITGYDLDPSGSCALKGSNTCRVCQKWNEQYRRKPEIFVKPSNEWYLDPYLENEKPKLKPKSK